MLCGCTGGGERVSGRAGVVGVRGEEGTFRGGEKCTRGGSHTHGASAVRAELAAARRVDIRVVPILQGLQEHRLSAGLPHPARAAVADFHAGQRQLPCQLYARLPKS